MSKLIATRIAQYPLLSEFTFNFDDTMANTSGTVVDFGLTNFAATTFDIINLPEGAVVIGGEVIVNTAYADCATATLSLGDASSATRYASAVDCKSAARTALTLTGYSTSANLRATVTVADSASAGKVTVRVEYVLPNRQNEIIPN